MTTVVFRGPTLRTEDVLGTLEADVREPAKRGDLLRAAIGRPDAILLIDGYFDRVQSTWHKEILWALSQGIHVFGASSMGALRAAELADFGMVGIGEIFAAYRSGELEDDDEVAVTHADADSGYLSTSEAMANIRWTLRAAERQQVISSSTRFCLEAAAKALPFYERHLRAVLGRADVPQSEVARLRDWLPTGRVDQKRADALSALRHVATVERTGWQALRPSFRLAETDGWIELRKETENDPGTQADHAIAPALEDELCAHGILGRTLMAAMTRRLASQRLSDSNVKLNARAVEAASEDFRRDRELLSAASFDSWLRRAGLEGGALDEFMRREAVLRATQAELRAVLGTAVKDELRAWGCFEQLRQASDQKQKVLAENGLRVPSLQGAGVTEAELWDWFFKERLRMAVPDSIVAYAAREGCTVENLRLAALRDLLFSRLVGSRDAARV